MWPPPRELRILLSFISKKLPRLSGEIGEAWEFLAQLREKVIALRQRTVRYAAWAARSLLILSFYCRLCRDIENRPIHLRQVL